MAIGGADPYTQLYLLRNHSILSATYPVEWSEPISIPKKKKKKKPTNQSIAKVKIAQFIFFHYFSNGYIVLRLFQFLYLIPSSHEHQDSQQLVSPMFIVIFKVKTSKSVLMGSNSRQILFLCIFILQEIEN